MFKVIIDIDALKDIQEVTYWYNKIVKGLGTRFQKQVKKQIKILKTQPTTFSIRYSNVRCMLIKKFPFLVHFTIDKQLHTVVVFAVIHTSRNPLIWEEKRNR